jgi:peroxiredoxin
MQVIDGMIADLEQSHLLNILDVGDQAPDFTLTAAQDGRQHTLSERAGGGPVIVSFYRGQW